jgi:ATP-dependent helicase HrpA
MALAEFYLQRLPEGMCRTVSLDKWLKAKPERMESLTMTKADVFRKEIEGQQDFPNQLHLPNRLRLPLQYKFSPGDTDDGMTINVTLAQLPLLREENLARLVPGLLPQKIETIIRGLAKPLRVKLQPATVQAQQAAKTLLTQSNQPFEQALAQTLSKQAGVAISPDDWLAIAIPEHLSPRICLMDGKKILATGRDLAVLQEQFSEAARLALREQSTITGQMVNDNASDIAKNWQWDDIARTQKIAGGGQAFLALVVDTDGVVLSPLPTSDEADRAHASGVRRLLALALAQTLNGVRKELLRQQGLCLPWSRWQRPCTDLIEQLVERALIHLTPTASQVRSRLDFDALLNAIRSKVTGQIRDYATQTQALLKQGQQLLADCARLQSPTRADSIADIEDFIQQRLNPSFVIDMSDSGWRDVPRYLKAAAYRLEKLTENLPLDERRQEEYKQVNRLMLQAKSRQKAQPEIYQQAQQMAIELWVMIFAQPLALKGSSSIKRLESLLVI